jgi:type IV secretion system protein TrbL
MTKNTFWIVFIVPLLLILSTGAFAAEGSGLADPSAEASSLLNLLHETANSWTGELGKYATYLLFSLALIQLVWTFGLKALDSNLELGSVIADLLRLIMVTSFFSMMITYLPSWGGLMVDSFREAAGRAGGMGKMLYPGDVLAIAVTLSNTVADGIFTLSPGTAVFNSFMSVIVLLCFTFIAAFMFVTLVESYIIICAGVFLMGFGGSSWTREFATSPLKYIVSVGAKLFVLTLIVSVISASADAWVEAYTKDSASSLTIAGLAIICAYLTKTIPELIAGMINGTSLGGGSAIGGLAMAGAAGTAGLAVGAGALAGGAASSAGGGISILAKSLGSSLAGNAPQAPQSDANSTITGGGGSPARSSGSPSNAPNTSGQSGEKGRKLAGAAMKTAGSMVALSVPGMESASSLGNISSAPSNGFEDTPRQEETGNDPASENSNIIRPEKPEPEK